MWMDKLLPYVIYNHVVLFIEAHLSLLSYSRFSTIRMIKHDMKDMWTTLISQPYFQQD